MHDGGGAVYQGRVDIMKEQLIGRIVIIISLWAGMDFRSGQLRRGRNGFGGADADLGIEGEKDIPRGSPGPSATTRTTEELFSAEDCAPLTPESVTPGSPI